MKVLSVNIEGYRHFDTILPLIDSEQPDVICLQETPEDTATHLTKREYHYHFTQQTEKLDGSDGTYKEGLILATKLPATFSQHYYHFPAAGISPERKIARQSTNACGVIHTELIHEHTTFLIGNTHFAWTPDGHTPNDWQEESMKHFQQYISNLPPHAMFGDFNIPRRHSYLYESLLTHYTDTIPEHHTSSLDKSIHRLKDDPDKAMMFSDFMVDYCFTQPPYTAKSVELRFGVSDHAAIIAEIEKA